MPFSLAPTPPDIGDLDGFSKSDIFEAEPAGKRLANIVGDLAGHSVIVLDGPWGSGKSVFARQWGGLLRQRGHPVVYFDAFAHDHLDDPFFALLSQVLSASSSHGISFSRLEEPKTSLLEKAAPLVQALPSVGAEVALRWLTSGAVSLADFQPGREEAETDRANAVVATIQERLEQVATQAACIEEFRATLGSAVSEMTSNSEATPVSDKAPLVFIVDELDRCRPSYALHLLERIKHVFAADGVCFVLVTHLKGLAAMVRREYGLVESDRYLDKFYQLRFDIQRILTRGPRAPHLRYLDHLARTMNLSRGDTELVSITVDNLVQVHDLTFRSQERIMLNLALFYRANGESGRDGMHMRHEQEGRLVLAAGLCVVRDIEPDLYRDASRGRLDFTRVSDFLKFEQWSDLSQIGLDRIKEIWKLVTVDGEDQMTEDETARWHASDLLDWRQRLVEVSAEIDQLWQ